MTQFVEVTMASHSTEGLPFSWTECSIEYPDAIWWRHSKSNMADGRHIENRLLAVSQRVIIW